MAEAEWLYVERAGGSVRRVTLLDEQLHVIATHERGDEWFVPEDCQLVRAAALERRAATALAS